MRRIVKKMKEFTINKNDADQRLDKFLSKAVKGLPQSLMYKYIRTKRIKINNKRAEISTRLCEGDIVALYINDEFFGGEKSKDAMFSIKVSIDVLYEDENILLIDKKPGMSVHEDELEKHNTLISHIQAYLHQKGEYSPEKEHSFAPALCNRIDKNTGGIVIAAKNAEALRDMNSAIKNNLLEKTYICAVIGTPSPKRGTLKSYIFKDASKNQVFVSDRPRKGAKTAVTKYEVIEERNGLSLVKVFLETGRTHQIRAQFAHIGHPLAGDGKYGKNSDNRKLRRNYQALYSSKLSFLKLPQNSSLSYLSGKKFQVKNVSFISELGFSSKLDDILKLR